VIEVQGLTKIYSTLTAVDDLSFSVAPGEVLGLVGPNGAGKTTTLRSIVGIVRPTRGRIQVAGHDVERDPVAAKRALAFMPDEPHLFDHLTMRTRASPPYSPSSSCPTRPALCPRSCRAG
jgi:ABC-2 type transport system ATP-binding protein